MKRLSIRPPPSDSSAGPRTRPCRAASRWRCRTSLAPGSHGAGAVWWLEWSWWAGSPGRIYTQTRGGFRRPGQSVCTCQKGMYLFCLLSPSGASGLFAVVPEPSGTTPPGVGRRVGFQVVINANPGAVCAADLPHGVSPISCGTKAPPCLPPSPSVLLSSGSQVLQSSPGRPPSEHQPLLPYTRGASFLWGWPPQLKR